jgi:hypothetical protein
MDRLRGVGITPSARPAIVHTVGMGNADPPAREQGAGPSNESGQNVTLPGEKTIFCLYSSVYALPQAGDIVFDGGMVVVNIRPRHQHCRSGSYNLRCGFCVYPAVYSDGRGEIVLFEQGA